MRISCLYIIFFLTALSFSAAYPLSGQPLSKLVVLGASDERLSAVLDRLMEQTDFSFVFPRKVDEYSLVTIPYGEHTVKEVLDMVLQKTDLRYETKGNTVSIYLKDDSEVPPRSLGQPVAFSVVGIVRDGSTEEPLPGVNILVKGTARGTSSDVDGRYAIDVNESDVLVFSFIGFKTFETLVSGHTAINVTLEGDAHALQEVTIKAGYYNTTDLEKTGSIVKVGAKEIERQPVSSPLMALQGRMPGVDITPNNGVAGAAINVVIRGRNSISNTNATPLYIVDGIPVDSRIVESVNIGLLRQQGYDPLSALSPANIESIEVLKDADATAIYGSRGANGVVLITTKRGGQSEKTNVDINVYSGIGKIPSSSFVSLLTTQQYLKLRKEAFANGGRTPSVGDAPDLLVWDTTRYTDWQRELLSGSAHVTDMQASLGGGSAFTNFRIGTGYHKESMIFPGDLGFQRITGSLNLNHSSHNRKFRAGFTFNYGVENNKLFNGDLVGSALGLPPNAPALYDSEGNLNWQNSTFGNPLAALKATDTNTGTNLIVNGNLTYELLPGLTTQVNLGYNTLNRNNIVKANAFSAQDPAQINGNFTATSQFAFTTRSSWIIEPQLNYSKKNGQHKINALIGASTQESNSAFQLVRATGYSSDLLMESLQGATKTTYLRDDDLQYRYMALFGRMGYNYGQKYFVNLTGRRDGSSRFGPSHRWGNFGALGAAWIFSEEKLMRKISFLSLGKIRSSYGITGSDQVGDYQYLSTYKFLPNPYQGKVSLSPSGLANANYAWEETSKLEAALELGFLQDRIRVETAFYRNRCSNQLLTYPLPGITGFTWVTQNLNATVQNEGWEMSLQTINIDRDEFQWSSALNLTLPKNTLLDFPGLGQSPYAYLYSIGQPLTIVRSFNYLGVNPTTGLYQVADIDGNGTIDQFDQTAIVDISRRVYGGLNNAFSFKGFELSFLIQFAQLAGDNFKFHYNLGRNNNVPIEVYIGRWQREGTLAQFQKPSVDSSVSGPSIYAQTSNAAFSNISFARLKTCSVSYAFSSALLDRLRLNSCKMYVQGQNLFTISDAPTLLDPEIGNNLPPLRMFTFGVDIKL